MPIPIRLPDGFLDELKARIRPSDVIGRKVSLKKKGKEWVGLSPFTNEKTPSFYVNDQKRIFKCFSSGMGGDVIKFVQETERLSFMEAVEKLAEEAGMQLPTATPEAQEVYDRNQRLRAACEEATKFYEAELRGSNGAAARTYLEGRGLSPDSWERHRLGYAPDSWDATREHLKKKGFSLKEIIGAGLAVEKDGGGEPYDRFRGRVIFPIPDSRGHPIAFGGRGLAPDAKPKYLNSSDTDIFHKGRVLYRYKDAREALGYGSGGGLIVCEGYMDAIALTEAGFAQAVAPLGTALTEEQLSLLWRAGPEPVLCFDGDRAGLGAAYRAIDRALPHVTPGQSLFFVVLPDGMDPDDYIKARGANAMGEALASAVPMIELLWRRERDAESVDTPERKAGLESRLKQAAAAIKDPAVRSAYERDLLGRMRDHFWQIRRAGRGGSKSADPAVIKGAPPNISGLGNIVRAIDSPALIEHASEELAAAQFADHDIGAIRDAIFELISAGKEVDRAAAHSHLLSTGKTRAANLLEKYPETSPLTPDEPEGREWLIALEQYAADESSDGAGLNDAGGSLSEDWAATIRSTGRRAAERRARKARVNEAAEQADNS